MIPVVTGTKRKIAFTASLSYGIFEQTSEFLTRASINHIFPDLTLKVLLSAVNWLRIATILSLPAADLFPPSFLSLWVMFTVLEKAKELEVEVLRRFISGSTIKYIYISQGPDRC
jgi:hypothetical protein